MPLRNIESIFLFSMLNRSINTFLKRFYFKTILDSQEVTKRIEFPHFPHRVTSYIIIEHYQNVPGNWYNTINYRTEENRTDFGFPSFYMHFWGCILKGVYIYVINITVKIQNCSITTKKLSCTTLHSHILLPNPKTLDKL